MAYTLQRKMFKMGGSVAHGGGVTSGLKLNKGGSVQEPQATFGVGNNANKTIGPDGKVREANYFFIPALASGIGGAAARMFAPSALRALYGGVRGLSTKPIKDFIKGKATGTAGKTITETGTGAAGRYVTRRTGERAFTAGDRARQALRAAELAAIPSGAGILGASALGGLSERAGLINAPEEDDRLATSLLKSGAEMATDYSLPNLAVRGAQKLFGDPEKLKNNEYRSLYEMIAGRESANKSPISNLGTIGTEVPSQKENITVQDVAKAEVESNEQDNAEALIRLREKYESFLNNDKQDMTVGNIGRAIAASASGLLDEDYGAAAAAYSDSLGGSMDTQKAEERQLQLAASELAMNELNTEQDRAYQRSQLEDQRTYQSEQTEEERAYNAEQMMQQLSTAAMLEGNTEQAIRTKKLLAAAEQAGGLENITELPMKANGKEIDTKEMKRGAIYTDTVGASTKTFIAVSLSGEAQEFDSYEKAVEFSNSGSA